MHRTPAAPRMPGRTLLAMAVAAACASLAAPAALALPQGEQAVAGSAVVQRPDANHMVVTQGQGPAILNWQGFSIGAGQSVRFAQPGADSVILNRVVGREPSALFGSLSANGRVFLVNPAGVLFGPQARVDVGGLVASTLDIADADFLAGRWRFTAGAAAPGAVVNQGSVAAADGGTVALLGGTVRNDGTVSARLGTVALAAGSQVELDFAGDGLTKLRVDAGAAGALVANAGSALADGGQVLMAARTADALAATVLDHTGLAQARSVSMREGRIVLDGGEAGVTQVAGRVDVSAGAGLRGGTAEITGHHVALLNPSVVDARGDAGGGTVLVGGDWQGGNPGVRQAQAVWMGRDAQVLADARQDGDGGKVVLWSTQATRAYGSISARGAGAGDGGKVETSGRYLDTQGVRVAVGAPGGAAGTWLLDPADVTILNGPTVNAGAAPNFEATALGSTVAVADIEAALNGGGHVSVSTHAFDPPPGEDEDGDIRIGAPITMTGAADASLTFNAHNDIFVGDTIRSTGGRLTLALNADSDGKDGGSVLIGGTIQTNGGDLRIYGASNPEQGFASGTEAIPHGVFLLTETVIDTRGNGGSGAITMRGRGALEGDGVRIEGSRIDADAAVTLVGIADNGTGVQIISTESPCECNAQSTALDVHGGLLSIRGQGLLDGVRVDSSTVLASGGGSIDIRGVGQFGGVLVDGDATIAARGSGTLFIAGTSAQSYGISLAGFDSPGGGGGGHLGDPASAGDIVMVASGGPEADALVLLDGTVQTTGTLNLRPGTVAGADAPTPFAVESSSATAITFNAGEGAFNDGFDISDADLGALVPGFSRIVVGGSGQTGAITVNGPLALADSLTLQGSGGITLDGPVTLGSAAAPRTLTLAAAAGDVVQTGPITADSLLLAGAGRFTLDNPGNALRVLALNDAGEVRLTSAGALSIDGVNGAAWESAQALQPLPAGASTARGPVRIRTLAGNLGLGQNLSSAAGSIDLVAAGRFDNYGRAQLSAPAGAWRIWQADWVGENRGGLVPSQPLPNFYGCTPDGGCSWGGAVPGSGGHFVYARQPEVSVSPAADPLLGSPSAGSAPLRPAAAGLLDFLGDTVADAVAGNYTSTVTPQSPPGIYAVQPPAGGFTSPSGYRITGVSTGRLVFLPSDPLAPTDRVPIDEQTYLYAHNMTLPNICLSTDALQRGGGITFNDPLGIEWSRVRAQPRVSNCVPVGERFGCADF